MKFSPIPVRSRLRFGLNILHSKYTKEWEKFDKMSGKDWLCQHIGEDAYKVIWHPLLKIKFGNYYDKISAAWVCHRIHRVATSRKSPLSQEKMGYIEGGTQTLIDEVKDRIIQMGGAIHLNSKVQKITKDDHSFKIILESGSQLSFDKIVLAVPLPAAAEIINNYYPEFNKAIIIDIIVNKEYWFYVIGYMKAFATFQKY